MSGVRGPNSALTEFLRSQGINANEIRLRHERRQRRSRRRRGSRGTGNGDEGGDDDVSGDNESDSENSQTEETSEVNSTPARDVSQDPEVEAIAAAAARKRRADESEAANEGTDLCASCHSRFTLTVYTRESPDQKGYLCRNCAAAGKSAPKAAKAKAAKRQRKKLAADLLELRNSTAPSLQDYCISLIANYIDDVDELGDLTATSVARLGRIICKNRRLNPRTLLLLLRRDITSLELSDCSELTAEAYNLIPAMCPNVKQLNLEMCGQLTGENLIRFAQQLPNLKEIHLDGAFLVRKSAWLDFIDIAGPRLEALTIKSVYRVDSEVLALMVETCTNLKFLSLHRLSQMTDDAPIFMLGGLAKLEHLELVELEPGAWSDVGLQTTLNMIGSQLKELVIRGAEDKLGDTFVDAVAASCGSLTRLDLQNLTQISEEAIVHLFEQWISIESNEGLTSLCLERCIQLGDRALAAALAHSRLTLVDLNINALKKVTSKTLEVLSLLPQLTRLDMGFVGSVDPVNIYQLATSKTLKQVLAFGNIRLSDMPLPTGLTVVGTM